MTWDTLRADVETLYAQAVEHQRVLKILNDDILNKARYGFELSMEAYRQNRIGFQQLIENYENLLRFRLDYFLRITSYEQAVAQLERAVGCVVAQWPLENAMPDERVEVESAQAMWNREPPFPRDR